MQSQQSLYSSLGEELGIRNIVDSMLEQARLNEYTLFKDANNQIDEQQLTTKYSMFISSLIEERYQWFYKDLLATNQLSSFLIREKDFETYISYFQTACVKNGINKPVIVTFLDTLVEHQGKICSTTDANSSSNKKEPLLESLEQEKKFEMFIEKYFKAI